MDRNTSLHPGMYLKVRFEADDSHSCILVPRKAVVGSVMSAKVYVVSDGKAESRPVRLGDMFGDRIEIIDGLQEGEKIVLAGLMNVSDGTVVRIVDEQ